MFKSVNPATGEEIAAYDDPATAANSGRSGCMNS
jgi:hypothetical protein